MFNQAEHGDQECRTLPNTVFTTYEGAQNGELRAQDRELGAMTKEAECPDNISPKYLTSYANDVYYYAHYARKSA